MPEYFADLITTRTLVVQSLYDCNASRLERTPPRRTTPTRGGPTLLSRARTPRPTASELDYTLRLGCYGADCSARQLAIFQQQPSRHMVAWAPLVNRTGNGVWSIACVDHTMTRYDWLSHTWEVPAGSGNTIAAAVKTWVEGGPGSSSWQDRVLWPHNAPCSGTPPSSAQPSPPPPLPPPPRQSWRWRWSATPVWGWVFAGPRWFDFRWGFGAPGFGWVWS